MIIRTMINKTYVEILNQFGYLSSSILMRRYKITREGAREILKYIVSDFENVYPILNDLICIQGREMKLHTAAKDKSIDELKPAKRQKWKDVTKP